MLDLDGKRALIFGVASDASIAWGIAKTLYSAGARISLGYQQRFKSRVTQLVKTSKMRVELCERCDVMDPKSVADFFEKIHGPVDIVVHSIAFANPESFSQGISELQEKDFLEALGVSAYSLVPLVRAAVPKMTSGGSVLAMTYLGGQRVVANYRLMGIAKAALEATVRELAAEVGPQAVRVNAISSGPIRTVAASQITGFDDKLVAFEKMAPMRRAITQSDVGNLAAFLSSDMSRNITGQVIFVDGGYSILAAG